MSSDSRKVSFMEEKDLNTVEYNFGSNLSESHKNLVSGSSPLWIVSYIENLKLAYLDILARCFEPKDNTDYLKQFESWVQQNTFFLAHNGHHDPSPVEITEDVLGKHLNQKCTLVYLLNHPERMRLSEEFKMRNPGDTHALTFILRTELISPVKGRYLKLFYPDYCEILDSLRSD